jgi:undecaprenyl-diphosphatase
MKMRKKIYLILSLLLWLAFVLWTWAVTYVDVQPIGPLDSSVGFATLNQAVRDKIGVNFPLYTVPDWLGLLPVATCLAFATLGLVQWISRRSLRKVDPSLFLLGGSYLLTIAVYLFFEAISINARPVLMQGYLETSYPSSTTLLTLCVMPTAFLQLHRRLRPGWWKRLLLWGIALFTVCMVIGRLCSGVHWVTDIIGGVLFSAGLVLLYYTLAGEKR